MGPDLSTSQDSNGFLCFSRGDQRAELSVILAADVLFETSAPQR